jgi:ankyrin repeat protein
VRVIFDYGAILDDLNTIWSPLHEAVKSYYYPCNGVIKWLLDHGAEVNSKDVSGRSLMFYAFKTEYRNSYQRSKKMVELLLEYRAEPSPEELGEHLFGSQYSFEMTKLLLDLGADVNMLNHDGMTPLHLLLSALDCNGHFEQLEPEKEERFTRLFISHGADVLLKDRESNTPLHLALDPRTLANANRVKQLLDAGAKVLCQSEDGFDPLLALLDDWPDLPYPDDDFDASNPRDLLCQELNRDWDLKTKEVNEMINAFVGFDHPTYILGDIDPLVAQHFPALDPFIPEEAKKEAREAREEEERKARQEKEEEKEEEEYTNKNPASQKVTEVH